MSVNKNKGPIIDPGMCRCCGVMKRCRLINVEYEYLGQKEIYSDLMMDCFGLLLSHLDSKQTERLICATCVSRLREAYSFRKQVLRCEEAFLQMKVYYDDNEVSEQKHSNHHQKQSVQVEIVKSEPADKMSDDERSPSPSPFGDALADDAVDCDNSMEVLKIEKKATDKTDSNSDEIPISQISASMKRLRRISNGLPSKKIKTEQLAFAPNAELLIEDMSFTNEVIDFKAEMFEETPTFENLYQNVTNIPSHSKNSNDCFQQNDEKNEPHISPPCQNPISPLNLTSIQDNLPNNEIDTLTPMPSPLISFSPIYHQIKDEPQDILHSDYTDTPVSSPVSVKKKYQKKKDKGRSRERYKSTWIDNSRTRKINKKKAMKSVCKCPRRCFDKLQDKVRNDTFNSFWELDHTRQWDFIAKYVSKLQRKRIVTENSSRNCTLVYSLPEDSVSIKKVHVCKTMFLNTLSISYNFVKTALDKFEKGFGVIEKDRRGKHLNHPKKIPTYAKESVCSHVKLFQPVESHYTRKETNKVYLDGSLTFFRMFNLYKEWCDNEQIPAISRVKTLRQYRDIVSKNFNLSFRVPKKDKCDFCHTFENLHNPTDEEQSKHKWHLAEKDRAGKLKETDKSLSKTDTTVVAVTFELQKTQNLPHGNVSTFYYKRKLNLYNFTQFDLADLQGYCYFWHEQTAKKGANEIASCVFDFISLKIKQGFKTFIFWSDNFGGQNRNRIIFLMYMYCAWKFNINITHRFLVVGHAQNEGDSIYSVIEKRTRNVFIYTPDQWMMALKMATADAKPYIVKEVTQSCVYDFKSCLPFFDNWKKSSCGELVMWSKICEVNVKAKDSFKLNYKYTFEDDTYKNIQCLRSNTRTSIQKLIKKINSLDLAYKSVLPIDKKKFNDLQDLCKSNVIPEKYHSFYNNLKTETERDSDLCD